MMTAPPEASDEALAHDLRRCISGFVRGIRQESGTPKSAQSEALDLLDRRGPMNVAALAEQRGVTHQTMRLVMGSLLADGSVRQVADPADGRSRLLSISPEGQNRLGQDRDARARWIRDAIGRRLSPAERDVIRAAIPLLDRIVDASAE